MAIEVFNRYENKYLLKENTFFRVYNRLLDYLELDYYNRTHEFYTICNIYYDTIDHHLIRTSLSKPVYKEKLRLRSYGVPGSGSEVYLEIKKKYRGLVNKRRTTMKLHEAYEFVDTGIKPQYQDYMNRQVVDEIHYLLKRHKVEPKVYLAYDRKAFFGKGQSDIRITFDTNIRARHDNLLLEYGDEGERLLESGVWLMEVKVEKHMPLWLTRLLSQEKVFKTSFSKYGRVYLNMLKNNTYEGDDNLCLHHFSLHPQQMVQYQ